MLPLHESLTPLDRLLFDGDGVRVGLVVAGPGDPDFRSDGRVRHHAIHFHETAVALQRERGEVVADSQVVTLFGRGDEFLRRAIDPRGERSLWIAFDDGLLGERATESLEQRDTAFAGRAQYLSYLTLLRALRDPGGPIPLRVDELALDLLHDVLDRPASRGGEGRSSNSPSAAANAVREYLAGRFTQPVSLARIGQAVGCSPYYLARLFRRHTGTTVHAYLTDLRLREALIRLSEGTSDLMRLALELGFSSHSHFSCRFRSAFAVAPSDVRDCFRRNDHRRLLALAERLAS